MKITKSSILTFYASIFILVSIFFKLTAIYFDNNPLNNNRKAKPNLISIFPQGWAFFTKSSKEPQFYIFDCGSPEPKLKNLRNFSPEYYLGASRKARILSIEINNVFQKISKDSIIGMTIKMSDIDSLQKKIKTQNIYFQKIEVRKKNAPDFKGKYLFVSQKMLPWNILRRKSDFPSVFTIYPIEIIQK